VLADNPVVTLSLVFVALYVATDVINRAQSGEAFLTPTQVATTFLFAAPLAFLAAGQTLVMLTGGVDLSVATTATSAAYATAWQGRGGVNALLLALAVGFGIGLVNGVGVGIFGANPLIMTLGTSAVTLGLLTILALKEWEPVVPGWVKTLGSERFFEYVPWNILLWAPLAALIILGLRYSGYGRMIYAVGGNPEAARLSGLNVRAVTTSVYVIMGFFAGLGAFVLAARLNSAEAIAGMGYELTVIASVVIGGTSLFGGSGTIFGTVVGTILIGVLLNGLQLNNVSSYVQQIIIGLIIVLAVAFDTFAKSRRRTA
jgi:ribose/xylose/arabinose/galactoside ABC-type transport system permease subunit